MVAANDLGGVSAGNRQNIADAHGASGILLRLYQLVTNNTAALRQRRSLAAVRRLRRGGSGTASGLRQAKVVRIENRNDQRECAK